MKRKENQANGRTAEQGRNANKRKNEQMNKPDERTKSQMTKPTIKRSRERPPTIHKRTNEKSRDSSTHIEPERNRKFTPPKLSETTSIPAPFI